MLSKEQGGFVSGLSCNRFNIYRYIQGQVVYVANFFLLVYCFVVVPFGGVLVFFWGEGRVKSGQCRKI